MKSLSQSHTVAKVRPESKSPVAATEEGGNRCLIIPGEVTPSISLKSLIGLSMAKNLSGKVILEE